MPPVSVTMQAMKSFDPPDGADDDADDAGADVAADDVLAAGALDVVELLELELLLPQAASVNAATDSPATTITLCMRRKTLTSPEPGVLKLMGG
jgi:hypothetical protein